MTPIENKFVAMPRLARLPKGREWVYFLRADCEARLIKIGHSVNLKWRLTGLQTQCPVQLSLVGLVQAPAGTEFVLHEALAESRAHGEWFRPTPEVEMVRQAIPRAGVIETPDVIRIVGALGLSGDRVREVLVWALSTQKHLESDEDFGRNDPASIKWKIESKTNPIPDDWRKRVADKFCR